MAFMELSAWTSLSITMIFLGCASYARGNGCDYATNALPSGWARYQGAQPQPGDILV